MKTLPLLALLLASQTAPAFAEPVAPLLSHAVQTADLDLTNAADRTRLAHRVRHAVNLVCGEASDTDLTGKNEVRRCRTETRRNVESQLNAAFASAERPAVVASAN